MRRLRKVSLNSYNLATDGGPEYMDLGSLIDEAKRISDDTKVSEFLEDLMEFEKNFIYSYKKEVLDLLSKHRENVGQ